MITVGGTPTWEDWEDSWVSRVKKDSTVTPRKMPTVFVSYVKEDSTVVSRIADVLRVFEVEVWLDKDSLKPGLRWQDQIRKGISEGDFFLACFSEAYVKRESTYMNEELTLAIEGLRDCDPRTGRGSFLSNSPHAKFPPAA